MNGDFIGHEVPLANSSGNTQQQINDAWTVMKSDMQTIYDLIRKRFIGTALLPSVGNNDVVVHNNVPCDDAFA